jgi:hypothetical protein
VPKAITVDNGT